MVSGMIRHSLVIPAYNEARLLPRLLESVHAARGRYTFGAENMEVVLADNDSTDATPELAGAWGCRIVHVPERRIAAARNGGARKARGEILTFVDADSRIHPETFNAVDEALARPGVVGGATGVTLERWSLGLTVTYLAFLPLAILTGMDTGVVFCRRADFELIGGYDERLDFAEDAAFLWALRKLGAGRRQKLARLRHVKAVASTRKFDRHGDWHYFTKLGPTCLPALLRRSGRCAFARRYWYSADR
jgi:glycosyltransferase involved in cell wall biosynthesis